MIGFVARTTALLLAPVCAFAADSLPRVFYTPAERAAIEVLRGHAARGQGIAPALVPASTQAPVESDPQQAAAKQAAARTLLRLDGISVAERGQVIAWIGGQRYPDGARLGSRRLEVSRQGVVLVDAAGQRQAVRVGESFDAHGHGAKAAR